MRAAAVADGHAAHDHLEHAHASDGAETLSRHVLLVEDNFVNQKVAVRFLERLGCTVEVASHGAEGVAACQQRHFDIVLMDLQMPVMTA